ncbi:hypothetical protein GOC74_00015 [Halomicrobium mukohataei]|uniref:HEAT repeat domain-containing protein n=1 Tax=Halomicrobium mukohataei TaxID=57705 RepID=A0A847U7Q8_9EURY|nr:hypothetical protein [Halomicrobium mukohataei]NLV08337.1 hypothetical protein [Halomicrobium mukohataei]
MVQDTAVRAVWREVENGNYTAAIRSKNILLQILKRGGSNERECAARALALLSFEYPDEAYQALDAAIQAATSAERESVRGNAMSIVAALAREYPSEVAQESEAIGDGLSDSHGTTVINAVEALAFTTRSDPQSALNILDKIEEHLSSTNSDVQRYATIVLYNVSDRHPGHVVQYDTQLVSLLSTANDEITRIAASGAICHIADQDPDRLARQLDNLESIFRAESDIRVRGNIIGILAKVSEKKPQKVCKFFSILKYSLSASDYTTLVNATSVISHIVEADPEAISESRIVPELRALWNRTDSQAIRANISHISREITQNADDRSSMQNHNLGSDFPLGMIGDAEQFVDESVQQIVLEVDKFFTDITHGDETTVEIVDSAIGQLEVDNEVDQE